MACVSACEEMEHGLTQTGDVGRVTDGVILETAPASQDVACEVRSVFCEQPKRTRLRDRKPTLKCSALGKRPRGRLKLRQILSKFGNHMSPCEHVHGAGCAARCECCSRDAWSGSPGRHSRSRLRCKPRGAVRVRVTSPGISQHEGRVSSARWLTWWIARKRALGTISRATLRFKLSANGRGRASCKPPPWRCKAFAQVPDRRP